MELNKLWQSQNLPVIEMRVGIFTGPIVAGSLGSRDRLEYCLLGDSVNIASRLESCEKDRQSEPCRILIAYQTLVYLPDVFEVESWGLIPLKGKQQLIDVYRILGWQSPPQP
ncbi:putative adenylate/guanylate cyclase [Limnospira maxima CS-328]|nr:putative adenylate/guanylate cyclase [Limnospira maxima CS-328]